MSLFACSGPIRRLGLIGLLLAASTAQAQLGGDATSVAGDAQALSAMPVRLTGNPVETWEIRTGSSTIREYLGSSGQVFAVSFSGGPTPKLDLLLGSYLSQFNLNVRHDRRSAHVTTTMLRAELHGVPGAISGVIWLPGLVPPGLNTGGLQ
jgi:hypothetical protein